MKTDFAFAGCIRCFHSLKGQCQLQQEIKAASQIIGEEWKECDISKFVSRI